MSERARVIDLGGGQYLLLSSSLRSVYSHTAHVRRPDRVGRAAGR